MAVRHLVVARAADRRLGIVRDQLSAIDGEIVIVAANRGAADDFARLLASSQAATFGVYRFSLTQLASRIARLDAARDGVSPAASLMIDAIASHASHKEADAGTLPHLSEVARMPGFPRAIRRTLSELRETHIPAEALAMMQPEGTDLSILLKRYDDALAEFSVSDVADMFARATHVLRTSMPPFLNQTIVFLDVGPGSVASREFIMALTDGAETCISTATPDDDVSVAFFQSLGYVQVSDDETDDRALNRVRRYLFRLDVPAGAPDESVQFFSAPGEGREAVEIARGVLRAARNGVQFDEIAVFLRNPAFYTAHLATAFRRAGVPSFFAHGTRRPDPSGRAFLALLACGAENLSAHRFAEYLSLGQVPLQPRQDAAPAPPEDDALNGVLGNERESDAEPEADEAALREPWKWEEIIVEAAVLGGADRWDRRLSGLEREYAARLRSLLADDPDTPRVETLKRDMKRLAELRAFAVPVISDLQRLAEAHTWRDWLDALDTLARQTLRAPQRVLRALADLRPLGDVGPVTYQDVLSVLTTRLMALERRQPAHRYGRVFVAPLDFARGRSFRVVFVPGVAERSFPQRVHEDPLLLDRARAALSPHLERQDERARNERLLLQLAAGAASEQIVLSYPRMEIREGRPRVSSFYALDVVRAVGGDIPDYEAIETAAYEAAGASMAWPAPERAADSIDALEYDLATLKPLLLDPDPASVRGRANYLVRLHPMLGRALRTRRSRWSSTWSDVDGLMDAPATLQTPFAALSLRARPYSPSSLQHFAACPYRFYLSAILRLRAREEPERIEALDALTRGTLVHAIYAAVLRELRTSRLLPLRAVNLAHARGVADRVMDNVVAHAYDDLAPAVDLVWETTVAAIRTDMHIWLGEIAAAADAWVPAHFELGFGLDDTTGLDEASVTTPARVSPDDFQLRGSIDLVERSTQAARIRVRDYKTNQDSTKRTLVVGAGEVLQPLVYAIAAEQVIGHPASEGHLWYATTRGGFKVRNVLADNAARTTLLAALRIIDGAITAADFPAAPRRDACAQCDFRRVCGPYEEIRIGRKDDRRLGSVMRLRRFQ